MRDSHLGESAAEIPWLMDGLTQDEFTNVLMLTAVPPEAAQLIASVYALPWLADGEWTSSQRSEQVSKRTAADTLRTLSFTDGPTTAKLLSFPWVASDDFSWYQSSGLTLIRDLLQESPTVAEEVLQFPWVRDDITPTEADALLSIREIAAEDLDLAWHLLKSPFMEPPLLQRDAYALEALHLASLSGPPPGIVQSGPDAELGSGERVGIYEGNSDLFARLAGQPWFSDGLDDDDAALLHGIHNAPDAFQLALIETNHVQTATVALPLSGETGFAVVRHTPFPPDDKTLQTLEEGARIMENFMGAPLSPGDVTLLLVEPEFWTVPGARADRPAFVQLGDPQEHPYVTAIIRAVNRRSGPPIRTLYHELGHYYLHNGPRWLVEGSANFLEAYVVAQIGGQRLHERLVHLESSERCAENIWDHVNPWTRGPCDYEVGEKFLLGMHAALGPEAVSAALRDLHTRALFGESPNHDSIYYVFLSNVPSGKEEAFRTAWLRYHGSPVIDRVHAESPDRHPLVALYNATGGEHWVNNRNWLSDAPLGAWYGVYTNAQGQVTRLDLAKIGLVGEIPSELGNLSNLIGLILSENHLTGEIPPELGDLIHLVQLNLQWNQLAGPIPPELGRLTKLKQMWLHGNQLTGSIPPELGRLTKLKRMWLHGNQFTGCIAAELPEIWVEATGLKRCEPADNSSP